MIQKFLKIYILLFVLLSDFVMFADDDPGTGFEDENGDTSGSVEEEAAINTKLIWLAIAAIAFAYYSYKKQYSLENK